MIAPGKKLRLKNTGDVGVVRDILDDGMISMYLPEEDMEIPVFWEDLEEIIVPVATPVPKQRSSNPKTPLTKKEKFLPPARVFTPEELRDQQQRYGIQLAFEPLVDTNVLVTQYNVWLINDLDKDCIYAVRYERDQQKVWTANGILRQYSGERIGLLDYDDLNHAPTFITECRQLHTQGTGARLEHSLRLKAKSFFKRKQHVPLMRSEMHWYALFPQLERHLPPPRTADDLREYTRREIEARESIKPDYFSYDTYNSREFAEFQPELDLHIEKLAGQHHNLPRRDIIRTQLAAFDAYLEKAIRLGVERVFVIHGVGKGRLRDAIATRLIQHPEVQTFKNEYHPKYGYGATEIML